MKKLDHSYAIAFVFPVGFIIWICIKVNEDDKE